MLIDDIPLVEVMQSVVDVAVVHTYVDRMRLPKRGSLLKSRAGKNIVECPSRKKGGNIRPADPPCGRNVAVTE